ncbi:InlB B-repeat-containing protein [Candidatus Saccharibacteria bacterium]|nr:InlB B-repeat-containing protein [Candidatus Saccharibacteria bacterium]
MASTNTSIKLNIVAPDAPTPAPVDPAVPNTGLFTHGIGGPEATAIGAVLIITIAAIVVAILYRKQKKSGKVTKLVHLVDSTKAVLKSKKRVTAGLTAIALLASAGTFTTLLANAGKSNTNAIEEDGLTLDVSSEDFTIEVGDEPVFAVLPVELTVEEATVAGYTLTAFTDSTDLVSTTNPDNIIPMVAVEGALTPLTDNTYGLALDEKPTTKDAEVYMPLSIDSEEPTILKATDYVETEANDTITIYYGFYITPDVPYGTYTGTNINYNVEPHYITNLSFNGNGNDGGVDMEGMTIIAGDTITLPENTYTKEGYNFIGWNTVAEPTEQDPGEAYADQAEYTAIEGETKNVILYAQWEEATLYMQDVATWGSKLEVGDEIIAVDNRDNKEYYVARLADGNIWMTQNLDLELSTEKTLTPADTNISANWTPNSSTISFTGTTVPGWQDDYNIPYSADPGDVYYYTSNTNDNDIQYSSLTECEAAGHTDCTHYHAGNYYNWSAAVASNDTSSMTEAYGNATDSICPAGWRLPKARSAESWTKGNEASNLLSSYDWLVGDEYIQTYYSEVGYGYYYQPGGFVAIRSNPLWLVRAGFVVGGSLSRGGEWSEYASSTSLNDFASFTELEIGYSQDTVLAIDMLYKFRSSGYSIRCVAQ